MAKKLFVGGLNWKTTDEGLREAFERFGEVAPGLEPDAGPALEHGFYRVEENEDVEQQPHVLEIIEVEGELAPRAGDVCPATRRVIIVNLRPAREAGNDEVTQTVLRNVLLIDSRDCWELGARAGGTCAARNSGRAVW